ncbi:hypothetical protein LG003_07665 [Photorhabdus kleinii]|uniref:hypothetical protein n=1 Tax=Photorhabdus kleinii TaxID=768034 RepID=UPI0021D5014B|nr:hypothetical protein [Photorhabdus kleinii]MCT8342748.1 hypothetical protein [Photorhabdus kleinii]
MKQRLKHLLKKWFPTIHPMPAKRLARWEKEILAVPPDIKNEETIKHVEILDCLNDKECWVRNPQRRFRNITLIPVTLGIISSLVLSVNDFIESRKKMRKLYIDGLVMPKRNMVKNSTCVMTYQRIWKMCVISAMIKKYH